MRSTGSGTPPISMLSMLASVPASIHQPMPTMDRVEVRASRGHAQPFDGRLGEQALLAPVSSSMLIA